MPIQVTHYERDMSKGVRIGVYTTIHDAEVRAREHAGQRYAYTEPKSNGLNTMVLMDGSVITMEKIE